MFPFSSLLFCSSPLIFLLWLTTWLKQEQDYIALCNAAGTQEALTNRAHRWKWCFGYDSELWSLITKGIFGPSNKPLEEEKYQIESPESNQSRVGHRRLTELYRSFGVTIPEINLSLLGGLWKSIILYRFPPLSPQFSSSWWYLDRKWYAHIVSGSLFSLWG